MQMRNWLFVSVGILDELKDELHLVLVVLNGNFLIDSMDTEGRSVSGRRYVKCDSIRVVTEHPPCLPTPTPIQLIFGLPWGQGEKSHCQCDLAVISQGPVLMYRKSGGNND